MAEQPKSNHGGVRVKAEPLTIVIPKARQYQKDVRGRKAWAAIYRGIGSNDQMIWACEEAGSDKPFVAFIMLLTMADNAGMVVGHPKKLAGEMLGMSAPTLMKALDCLERAVGDDGVPLIERKARRKQESNQVGSKKEARSDQVGLACSQLEQSANDAGSSECPLITVTNVTNNQTKERVNPEDFADESDRTPPSVSPPGLDPVKLISDAMSAAMIPPTTADPMLGYRAKAQGCISRKPPELDTATYTNWVCMTIAAVGNCPDWEVRVNKALKESRAAGAYIAPERPRGSTPTGRKLQDEFGV